MIVLITGVLENVKQEFYRRVAEPYEDWMIVSSNDIPEYTEYENWITDERLKAWESKPITNAVDSSESGPDAQRTVSKISTSHTGNIKV
jgi:hypothetical protein